jgi:hypothetical protein
VYNRPSRGEGDRGEAARIRRLDNALVVRVVVICALAGALSGLFVMWFNREKLKRQQQFIRYYFYGAFLLSCVVILIFIVSVILKRFGIDLFPA